MEMTTKSIAKTYKNNNYNKKDFRSFLQLLENENELVRINKPVNPKFELAAIVSKLEGKQALYLKR